ncbi:FAD:protein FMN transferase [Paenibacillus sp. CECT 9249]|uniref:FAD:protein FMN transferase n=1 Tax=Paenibacillus sp. CECT 9249 TaxID=2845385 RepID=UPI001E6308B6|nr:FAD:protein FMN transferase [Paenibacillus sp. CECT 9249]
MSSFIIPVRAKSFCDDSYSGEKIGFAIIARQNFDRQGSDMRTKPLFSGYVLSLVILLLGASGCAPISAPGASNGSGLPISRTYFAFDTIVTVKVYDERVTDAHFKELESLMKEIEGKLSRTIETSDVSQVNLQAGQEAVRVSDETFGLVRQAVGYAELTDGRFDPAIGPLVDLWQIGKEGAKVPPQADIERKRDLVDFRNIETDETNRTVKLAQSGMSIDLGGIGKGYAADRIAERLLEMGFKSAIIDLGGNIMAVGTKPGGELWNIGIQAPDEMRGNPIGQIRVDNQTIVTSGVYERYFMENGQRYHHILDTKTGYPVRNELISVTIVADRSADADALSTAAFALGLEEGLQLTQSLDRVEALFVTAERKVYMTDGLIKSFRLTDETYELANLAAKAN